MKNDTWVLRRSLIAVLLLAPVAAVVGGLARGGHGVAGALAGSALTLLFFGITVLTLTRTRTASLDVLRIAVMGSFLAKLLVAIVAVAVVSKVDALDSKVFALTVVAGVLVFLTAETFVVLRVSGAGVLPVEPVATTRADAADDDAAVAAARAARAQRD